MVVLCHQEKIAISILILVTLVCLVGTYLIDGIGKEQFSKEYALGMAEGTLVSWSGTVSSMNVASGGSIILEVSGVSVFIPAGGGTVPDLSEGTTVEIIGTVQHWKGKEEILVENAMDIRII